jgi:hypothetical protein
MQLTTLTILAVSLLAGQSYAYSCKANLLYCGSVLVNSKKYSNSDIQAAVSRQSPGGGVPSDADIPKSTFRCYSNDKLLWINGRKQCSGRCIDGGSGNSDYCE